MASKKSKNKQKQDDWSMEQWESWARKRTAWAHYHQQMSYIRAVEEEKEYQEAKYKHDDKKVKEIEDKRKNRGNNLVIF